MTHARLARPTLCSSALLWIPIGVCAPLGCGHRGEASGDQVAPAAAAPAGHETTLLSENATLALEPVSHSVTLHRGDRVRVSVQSGAFDPQLELVSPSGRHLSNDDHEGARDRAQIELVAEADGELKIRTQASDGRRGAFVVNAVRTAQNVTLPPALEPSLMRSFLQTGDPTRLPGGGGSAGATHAAAGGVGHPPTAATLPVRIGDRVSGNLTTTDRQVGGRYSDTYRLTVTTAQSLTIQMESSALDAFLTVTNGHGVDEQNDDSGGTRNAQVTLQVQPGTYDIVCTTFRPGEVGSYTLKVMNERVAAAPSSPANGSATPNASEVITGELTSEARQQNGRYVHEQRMTFTPGTPVRLVLTSTAFDTLLRVRPPRGAQLENDDAEGTNSALDFVATRGNYTVVVTSYEAGATGHFELTTLRGAAASGASVSAGTTPPTGSNTGTNRTIAGELRRGDRTLRSGEFADTQRVRLPSGGPVTVRVVSSEFDTYLMLQTPDGQNEQNDDAAPGNTNSEIEVSSPSGGEYQVTVTSYRPGETGHYNLYVIPSAGSDAAPTPTDQVPVPNVAGALPSAGNRVWTVSVGITDYPGSVNDLPQCANDARRIAESLRTQGLTTQATEFLFTDAQATTANVRQALTNVVRQAGPDDVIVFFYSGHGGQEPQHHPNDPNELDEVNEYLVLYDGHLVDDELGQVMAQSRARVSLVALDACFSGGFAKDVVARPGIVGMFSSEEDVTSAVAAQFQAGGYLSHFLRLGLEGRADRDPRDSVLTVGELTHFVWQQYGEQASDVRMSEGYQQLVVDRGAVRTGARLFALRR